MGTMLYNKGVFINQCYDELNLRAPDLVRDVHKAYKKAGAEVLETNSFGANRLKLEQYGLSAQVAEINRAAAKLAREVAEDDLLGAGARCIWCRRHRAQVLGRAPDHSRCDREDGAQDAAQAQRAAKRGNAA